MNLNKGLKIMTLDATDLLKVDETGKVVPSNLSQFYDYKDEKTGEVLKLRKRNLFKMKMENSMALDELVRLLEQKRMIGKSIFKVGFKYSTDQVIHVTFKYSSLTSTDPDDKDEETGKVNKHRVRGYNKEKIRKLLYDKYNEDNFTFKMDGIEYVRWIRSGNTAREGNCLFINKELLSGMNAFTDCGIKPKKKPLNLASFEAYRALVLSIKIDDLEIKPENILVIDDVKSTFKEKVMYTGEKDKELFTTEKDLTITNKIFDGQSLIDKSLMGKYQDKGMLLLRHKFFKSCCFNANIQDWFRDNNITEVSQLNGQTLATKIEDVKLITTPSSIKYCKFGKKNSWFEDWIKQITKHNKPFGIVKYEKPTKFFKGKLVRTHYQILNTLQITADEIKKLLQPTLDYLELLKTDPTVMYHYCETHSDDEDSDLMMNVKADIIHRMMKLNENFKNTAMYESLAKKILEDFRSDIKCGRILVKGNYSTVLGNPIEMLQAAIGKYIPETSIVGKGNIISTAFDKKQLSIMSGLEIDKAKKTLIVDNKTELKKIKEKYKVDGKIEYPEFFRELSRKGKYDSKKKYRYYNTALDMIGKQIAYMELVVKNDEKALESIIAKPSWVRERDCDRDKIEAIKEICEQRVKDDNSLAKKKSDKKISKSQFVKRRKLNIENFTDALEEYKDLGKATIYFLLIDEEMQKYTDYLLQGLLEIGCTNLKEMVAIEDKTKTLVEDKDGDINIYGIKHKEVA